jgi:hypothetical protein
MGKAISSVGSAIGNVVSNPISAVGLGSILGPVGSIGGSMFGGKANGIVDAINPINFLTGKGGLSEALGLSSAQGEYYKPNTELSDKISDETKYLTSKTASNEIEGFKKYGMKYMPEDVLNREAIVTDPIMGSRVAEKEATDSELLRGIFRNEGKQQAVFDNLLAEQNRLSGQGYNLQKEDREAYGQAAGDIQRQYAQQENDLTKQLAARGLASSGSGAAGAAFSGLAGNKYEQLAKMQTNLADKRMQNTAERLNQTRSQIGQYATLGQAAKDAQNQRQMGAVNSRRDYLTQGAALQQNANQQAMQSVADMRANKGQSVLQGFGQGLFGGVQQLGTKAGNGSLFGF